LTGEGRFREGPCFYDETGTDLTPRRAADEFDGYLLVNVNLLYLPQVTFT